MTESTKDIATPLQMRLKHKAKEMNRPYGEILQYYGIERFLYRLSKTHHAEHFILKGGLVFHIWEISLRRPTKDIDFRGYLDNSRENILQVIKDVIAIPFSEDGIVFDPDSIVVEETQIDADYDGIRASFLGHLGRSRIPMQIDIGFSDEIASKAELVEYPVLLNNMKGAQLKGYPKESVISEKFHAMVVLGELNSRLKDYYDIWLISEMFEFDDQMLQKAIEKTFTKRQTEIPNEKPVGLTIEFSKANRTKWKNFLNKFSLQNNAIEDFVEVANSIWFFLEYPVQISLKGNSSKHLHWYPRRGWK